LFLVINITEMANISRCAERGERTEVL